MIFFWIETLFTVPKTSIETSMREIKLLDTKKWVWMQRKITVVNIFIFFRNNKISLQTSQKWMCNRTFPHEKIETIRETLCLEIIPEKTNIHGKNREKSKKIMHFCKHKQYADSHAKIKKIFLSTRFVKFWIFAVRPQYYKSNLFLWNHMCPTTGLEQFY